MYIRNPPRAITSHGRHGKEQIFKHIENLFYMKFRGGYLDFHAYGIEKSQIATAGIRQQSTRATVELANDLQSDSLPAVTWQTPLQCGHMSQSSGRTWSASQICKRTTPRDGTCMSCVMCHDMPSLATTFVTGSMDL